MNLSKQAIIFKLMKHSQLTHCWGIYRECCPFQKGRNSIFLPQQPRSTPVRLHSLVPPVLAPGHQVGLLMFPRRLSGSTPSSFSWLLRRRVRSVKQRLHQSYPTVRSKPRSFNEQNCSVSFYKFGSNDLPQEVVTCSASDLSDSCGADNNRTCIRLYVRDTYADCDDPEAFYNKAGRVHDPAWLLQRGCDRNLFSREDCRRGFHLKFMFRSQRSLFFLVSDRWIRFLSTF